MCFPQNLHGISVCMGVQIEPPQREVQTSKAELMEYFETMQRMRRCELEADTVRQPPSSAHNVLNTQIPAFPTTTEYAASLSIGPRDVMPSPYLKRGMPVEGIMWCSSEVMPSSIVIR